jgi:N-acetylneuraminic acid mutarotase/glucose/arabinose dehydrogenase
MLAMLMAVLVPGLERAAPALAQLSPIAFASARLEGAAAVNPTTLTFAPDGRLVVTELNGLIHLYTVEAAPEGGYRVAATETLTFVRDLPNHNDDGTPHAVQQRMLTGLLAVGTPENPVLYVSSSDYRVSYDTFLGFNEETGVDTNSGVITRLTWDGAAWQALDIVRGLPRSGYNHATNGMALDTATNTLLVAQGSNTNAGTPLDTFYESVPEYALTNAVLAVDLDAIGETTYELPTLDDPDRPGNPDPGDPFGGNNGLNQARIVEGGPVSIYAPGYRNLYDIVLTETGLYGFDNNPNLDWGGTPIDCTHTPNDLFTGTVPGALHRITPGSYGGSSNVVRGNASLFPADNSPILAEDPRQCTFIPPADSESALWPVTDPVQGFTQYTTSAFDGALQGDLLAATWNGGSVNRYMLSEDGLTVLDESILFENFGGRPLDVAVQGDDGPFPGTVWVALFDDSAIAVFTPTTVVSLPDDRDGDGYTDQDEMLFGSDPDNSGSLPNDWDGDGFGDRLDTDDDNDGVPDNDDPFAIDPANGRETVLPLRYTWDAGNPGTGLLDIGFTGLLLTGLDDYLDLYSADDVIDGGAQGKVTVVAEVPTMDFETQRNSFQLGVPLDAPLTVYTRMVGPFFNDDHQPYQSQGLVIGTGFAQDSVRVLFLDGGVGVQMNTNSALAMQEYYFADYFTWTPYIDLYFDIDPAAEGGPRARVRWAVPGHTGYIGESFVLPWLEDRDALAVGLIAGTGGGPAFSAHWDLLEVTAFTGDVNALDYITPEGTAIPQPPPEAAQMPTPAPVQAADPTAQAFIDCGFAPIAPFPITLYEPGAIAIGDRYYVFGGFLESTNYTRSNRVFSYDVTAGPNGTWTEHGPMPLPYNHAALAADAATGTIWLAGGFDANGQLMNQLFRYDVATDTWNTDFAQLPVPLSAGILAHIDGTLHYIGGLISRNDGNPNHYSLDVTAPGAAWQTVLTPPPVAYNHMTGFVREGSIYQIGGQIRHDDNTTESDTLLRYDAASNTWTVLAALPAPRSHAEYSALADADSLYLLGGRTLGSPETWDDVYRYDFAADTWSLFGHLPFNRYGHIMFQAGDGIIIGMGHDADRVVHGDLWFGTLGGTCQPAGPVTVLDTSQPPTAAPAAAPAAVSAAALTAVPAAAPTAVPAAVAVAAPVTAVGAPLPANAAAAYFSIETSAADGSTAEAGAFTIENRSIGGQQITSIVYDLGDTLLPLPVFDPEGTLGDTGGKPFSLDGGLAVPGTVAYTPTTMGLTFTRFAPGEVLAFSVDVDASGITGQPPPGPGGSGGVNAHELLGTRVTVGFSDGSFATGRMTHEAAGDGARVGVLVVAGRIAAPAPNLRLVGLADAFGPLVISGQPYTPVTVVAGVGVGYPIDGVEPGSGVIHSIERVEVTTVTLDATGQGVVTVPVEAGKTTRITAAYLLGGSESAQAAPFIVVVGG